MTLEIWVIYGIILFSLVLFAIGPWRYDVVSLIVLIVVALFGLIPIENAFLGFGNPAVITVAAVLVLTKGLQNSGFVQLIGEQLLKLKGGIVVQLGAMAGIVALLSAFMNNVGAVALMMPVAVHVARKKNIPISMLLMPIAFVAHFGGMATLIGTPTNLIASSFRNEIVGSPYRMFDFLPLGLGLSFASFLFLVLIGWRLIPKRQGASSQREIFDIDKYLTEVRIPGTSSLVGKRLSDLKSFVEDSINVVSLIREGERRMAPSPQTKFKPEDILEIQVDTENLEKLLFRTGLELVGSGEITRGDLESEEMKLMEVVIKTNSMLENQSAYSLDLRRRYGVNLLAIARQGEQFHKRLDRIKMKPGDVLLMQGYTRTLRESMKVLGCLPLEPRDLKFSSPKKIFLAVGIFFFAIAMASLQIIPVSLSFSIGVVAMVMTKLVNLKDAYESVDWPVIILIGTQIPIGEALESTGGAQLIAEYILRLQDVLSPIVLLILVLVVTMSLSDLVKNAAAVVLMTPIAIRLAFGMGVSVDPFIMAIVVGGACAFLTPFGHQSNVLVMGPGGYHFGDYWKIGLILEVIVILIGVPLILFLWPF